MSERELNPEYLADWAEGRLSEEEARTIEERLEGADEATRADAGWLRAFSRATRDVVLDDPPAGQRAELAKAFEAYARGRRQPGTLKRLTATLSFGGRLQPAAVRSTGGAGGQLIYTTETADIALNVRRRPENGMLNLDGQIFPNDDEEPEAFGVQILRGIDEVGTTATDELGEFAFEGVPPGEYQILVSSEQVEILISPVDLRA
ncbi:MAG: carboxypeptidase-like regulatory domain-containing protein [Rubrobacter sp.]